jgi:hypothetical protein
MSIFIKENSVYMYWKKIGELPNDKIQDIEETIFLNIQKIMDNKYEITSLNPKPTYEEEDIDTQIFP